MTLKRLIKTVLSVFFFQLSLLSCDFSSVHDNFRRRQATELLSLLFLLKPRVEKRLRKARCPTQVTFREFKTVRLLLRLEFVCYFEWLQMRVENSLFGGGTLCLSSSRAVIAAVTSATVSTDDATTAVALRHSPKPCGMHIILNGHTFILSSPDSPSPQTSATGRYC